MKKTVSFTKDLEFPMQIGEITQITLENDLKFIDQNNIEGKFLIAGKYKMTEASRFEEDFSFNLPVEIAVAEKCDLDTCKISITDFNYEVVDEEVLRANIDVLIDGPFILEEKSFDVRFRGSKNQRVIDVEKSLSNGKVVILKGYDEISIPYNPLQRTYMYI